MYGPPLFCKRKVTLASWSAQMYSAFVGDLVLRATMGCAALCSSLSRKSQETVLLHRFPERRDRPLCHRKIRQQTWQVCGLHSQPVGVKMVSGW